MKTKTPAPVNTLEEAFQLAQILLQDLARGDGKTWRGYDIFSALASDEGEALAAYLIWRARGETIHDLTHQP